MHPTVIAWGNSTLCSNTHNFRLHPKSYSLSDPSRYTRYTHEDKYFTHTSTHITIDCPPLYFCSDSPCFHQVFSHHRRGTKEDHQRLTSDTHTSCPVRKVPRKRRLRRPRRLLVENNLPTVRLLVKSRLLKTQLIGNFQDANAIGLRLTDTHPISHIDDDAERSSGIPHTVS